jgi:hypothetical protein
VRLKWVGAPFRESSGDSSHFTVAHRTDSHYDVALVLDGQILEFGKAEALAQWHTRENALPFR